MNFSYYLEVASYTSALFLGALFTALLLWLVFFGAPCTIKRTLPTKEEGIAGYLLILLGCVIGLVAGILTGLSRDSAVSGVVPAVLGLIGVIAGGVFATSGAQLSISQARAVSVLAASIGLTLLLAGGALIGANERLVWERYQSERDLQKIIQSQKFELEKMEYQAKLEVQKARLTSNIRNGIDLDLSLNGQNGLMLESGSPNSDPKE